MLKKLFSIIMIIGFFTALNGCTSHSPFEASLETNTNTSSLCDDISNEHTPNHEHHCPCHCNHAYFYSSNPQFLIEITKELVPAPYLFIYENEILETLKRPPLNT